MAKANLKRTKAIVAYYSNGHSLRETGKRFAVTYQRVHQLVHRYARQELRAPFVSNARGMRK
jgi:transposase